MKVHQGVLSGVCSMCFQACFSVLLNRMLIPTERMTRLMQLLNQKPDEPVILDGIREGTSPKANV